jgi:hypothetical protein
VDTVVDQVRTVRIACELRFRARAAKVFEAITDRTLEWFPHTYGGDKVRAVVVEPHIGGRLYEDWGEGHGHLYGHVTRYDPPHEFAIRGRLMPGTLLDTEYEIVEEGAYAVLRMTKVAVGPMTDEEAAGINRFGDLANFAEAPCAR